MKKEYNALHQRHTEVGAALTGLGLQGPLGATLRESGRSRTHVAVADLGLPPWRFFLGILLPTLRAVSLMLVGLHSSELCHYLCPSTASPERDRLEGGGIEASLSRCYSRRRVLLYR